MATLVKVNTPVNTEVVLRKWLVPEVSYSIKPEYSPSGKLLNSEEYYASVKTTNIEMDSRYIVDNPEYFKIKSEYLQFVNPYREKMEDQFIGGMPIQLEGDCVRQLLRVNQKNNELVYSVTLKVDGERFIMFINENSTVYLMDRSTNIFYFLLHDFKIKFQGLTNCILDGELIINPDKTYEYLIFDILFYKGQSVMNLDYPGRYNYSKKALEIIQDSDTPRLSCSLKEWFPITEILKSGNFYNNIKDLTNKTRRLKKKPLLVADGLILQPNDGRYIPFREWNGYNNVQFKWKPPDQLTVDFKIKIISNKKWILLTSTDEQYMISQPGADPIPAICQPNEEDLFKYSNGEVVEFILKYRGNPQHNLFVAQRSRNEKKANSYRTIMSTLNAIEANFKLDTLQPAFKSITSPFTKESIQKILIHFSQSELILKSLRFEKAMFFDEKQINSIKEIYSKIQEVDNPEFECRIYNYTKPKKKDTSGPVVMSKSTYFYLLDFFWQSFPIESENTIDVYLNDRSKSKYRSTYNNIQDIYSKKSIVNTAKESISSYILVPGDFKKKLYNNLSMKIDLSKEDPIDQIIGLQSQIGERKVTNNIRIKSRKTFRVNEWWRVDFTRIKTSFNIGDILEKNEIFELECEFIGKNISFNDMIRTLNDLYMLILGNSGYC